MSNSPEKKTNEYLVMLDAQESSMALHKGFMAKSDFVVLIEGQAPLVGRIEKFENNKALLQISSQILETVKFFLQTAKVGNIKFSVGTEIFFIKSPIEVVENFLAFQQASPLVQLKRRQHQRFTIPEQWQQQTYIRQIELKLRFEAKVLDISMGGVKMEAQLGTFQINKGDTIRLQFQIHKRSEVLADAQVKFVMLKGIQTVLGLQFTNIQDSSVTRVRSLVEDLALHHKENLTEG